MSMVERLAKKYADNNHGGDINNEYHTRWWLNAIADELEQEFVKRDVDYVSFASVGRWLRTQANTDD